MNVQHEAPPPVSVVGLGDGDIYVGNKCTPAEMLMAGGRGPYTCGRRGFMGNLCTSSEFSVTQNLSKPPIPLILKKQPGFPGGPGVKSPSCQCRGHTSLWSGEDPTCRGPLSPRTTSPEPCACNEGSPALRARDCASARHTQWKLGHSSDHPVQPAGSK